MRPGGFMMLALAIAVFGVPAAPALARKPALHVVAKDLDNPRKVYVEPGGAVDVVEAGTGGTDTCLGTGANTTCVGRTGSITRVANGRQRRIVTRLPSWASPTQQHAAGPADVALQDGSYVVVMQDALSSSNGANLFGADGRLAGDLIKTPPGHARPTVLADLSAYEVAHNPDRGAGPGSSFGNPSIDSDPYALTPFRGGFAVVDAAANDLLWVDARGRVSVLAVFPTRTVRLTKAVARKIGASTSLRTLSVQSVPSCVAVGPDGALYVGELTGRPFQPGTARVWRVVPGEKPTVYAKAFTTVSDIAFDRGDLLVLEIAERGLLDPTSPGALIRVSRHGKRTVLASAGLVAPAGMAVHAGDVYIANYGLFPGSGPGRHGELVRLRLHR